MAEEAKSQILIVDDEPQIYELLLALFEREGLAASYADNGRTALQMIHSRRPDLLLTDLKMPGMDGMKLLKEVRALDLDLPVVIFTGFADVQGAVDAMLAGADYYLAKPFENQHIIEVLKEIIACHRPESASESSSRQEGADLLRRTMGPSAQIARLDSCVKRIARSNLSVLIEGETGSGKELVAQAIHQASSRAAGPFMPVDCGAIPDMLLESELFGHEKGAFTGAITAQSGKFEAAKGGTLFLDEVSNLPFSAQAKLLRVLQEKMIYRLGSAKLIPIDVRIVAASNRDLLVLIEEKSFRADLFFRLNDFTITIPSLRKRRDDIPYLAERFLTIFNREFKKNVKGFSTAALDILTSYDWPGNVRQLRSIIRRSVLFADNLIQEKHLDPLTAQMCPARTTMRQSSSPQEQPLKKIVDENTREIERQIIVSTLQQTGGNKAAAARLLKVDYKTLHSKIKKMAIKV